MMLVIFKKDDMYSVAELTPFGAEMIDSPDYEEDDGWWGEWSEYIPGESVLEILNKHIELVEV